MNRTRVLQGLMGTQPLLKIQNSNDGTTIINGMYQINEFVFGKQYLENFTVKITFTPKYPREIPKVYVYGNRFDKCEHRCANGLLCLETPHNLKAFLKNKPTIKDFLIKFLTPFFVGFIYYEETGKYLFGEHQHGDIGIIEMYTERFGTKDKNVALKLLGIVALKKYRGHMLCPCDSGKRIRKCHGQNNLLINMINSPEQRLYADSFDTLSAKYQNRR